MTAPAEVVEIRHELRGAARELMGLRHGEVLLSGAAGTGKSRACMIKLHTAALKYPGADLLVVRKRAKTLSSSFTTEWESLVAAELATGAVKYYGGSARKPAQYQYENGSTVTLGGMDLAIKVMSTQRDMIYVQEATELTVNDWESLTTRARGTTMPYKQVIADCNPDAESHWLKQRANTGSIRLLISVHEDNPRYFHADRVTKPAEGVDYIAKLDALTGVRYLRLRLGLWAAAQGAIYEDWSPELLHVPRFEIPEDWPRYWVVDFGHTHPFVCQWWAEDDDGRLFMYREIHMTKRLVEDHARHILRLVSEPVSELAKLDTNELGPIWDLDNGRRRWTEPEPYDVITDHDAEGRATLEKYLGVTTTAATKAVLEGIQMVQARMRPAGDGRPRLFILQDSLVEKDPELVERMQPTCLVEEIPGYRWDEKDGPGKKERPIKELDDGCDVMRYMVAAKDLGPGAPELRSVGGRR